MDRELQSFIEISRAVGQDARLVQGGGGNTSVKTADGQFMYIKASGTALKDASETKGWRKVKMADVLSIIKDKSLRAMESAEREARIAGMLNLACVDACNSASRPSVEAHLHAMLSPCVIHLHPLAVGAYVSAKNGKALLEDLFASEEIPPLWVPYVDPGYTLAMKVASLVKQYEKTHGRKPRILFLEKHGLFVCDETPEAAVALTHRVLATCASKLTASGSVSVPSPSFEDVSAAKLALRKAFFEVIGDYLNVRHTMDEDIARFLARDDAKEIATLPALTPDEIVYANGSPMWVDSFDADAIAKRIRQQMAKGDKPAFSFLSKDLGLFVVGTESSTQTIKDVIVNSLGVRAFAADFGGVNALNARQSYFIIHWEAESFRKQVAGAGTGGELKGRIAVVTGAGSGLGRSIAIGLARASATVALADVDPAGAEQTAEMIRAENPKASVMPLKCDVTKEESVIDGYKAIMDRWGGLDIMVNAAGIAPAYALVDLPVDKWRLALEINLTGYFLMAREAAKIMIPQAIGGSMVNLSSKSGLDASKSNTPYNATKAGELHMARGWALELGPHGIRVNCVAPGNVFEGSKIWNPEYIKTCAKKYGIKPEEVIPHYVNMTALKREIKGQDIANAVVFLSSDNARMMTGQTLVVDCGQVMVR